MPNSGIDYETVYLTSLNGSDKRIAVVRFVHEQHSWNSRSYMWGTPFEEHRFNFDTLQALSSILDKVESDKSLVGMILTGRGKYFSNGFDTNFIKANPGKATEIQVSLERIMGRVLNLPMVTIAAINGHCTATGAILALCCDFRIMCERGLFFVPAVNLGIVYSQGMIEIMKSKIADPNLQRDFMLLGQRYSSLELIQAGIVSEICSHDALENNATALIRNHWKEHGESYGAIRSRMYKNAREELSKSSDMQWERLSSKL
jgi:enoyl-CoA hydratase/carnithine racemase